MTAKETTVDLASILALLQEVKAGQDTMAERVGVLEKRVETQDAALPKMVPIESYRPWEEGSPNEVIAQLGANGQIEGSLKSVPHDDMGRPLDAYTMTMRPPTYQKGQAVRINPDAVRDGFPEGLTWGKQLAKYQATGVGKVMQVLHLMRKGQWCYRIKVDRVGGQPNGFLKVDDAELLPA